MTTTDDTTTPAPGDAQPETAAPAPGPETPTALAGDDTMPVNWWSTDTVSRRTTGAPGVPRTPGDDWWDDLYRHPDADLDTNTGQPRKLPGTSDRGPAGPRPAHHEDQADPKPSTETAPGDADPAARAIGEAAVPAAGEALERTADPGGLNAPGSWREHLPLSIAPERLRKVRRPWRWLLFNGSAAATGYAVGLSAYLSQFPPAAVQAAGGLLALAFALLAGFTAWRAGGSRIVADFLPGGAAGRLILVVVLAEVGRRLGPAALPFAAGYSNQYLGLDQQQVALLITGIVLCGGTGWLAWRVRGRSLLVRWFARIPCATALLVCALYSNGPVA